MRVSTILMRGLMAFAVLGLVTACSNSKNPIEPTEFPDPVEAVATDIVLSVYSVASGDLVETVVLETEAPVQIGVGEFHAPILPGMMYIYAEAAGFYTELYYCDSGDVIDVDLDGVPAGGHGITGTVFGCDIFNGDIVGADATLIVLAPSGESWEVRTDFQGRFGLGGLPAGRYEISMTYPDTFFVIDHGSFTDYRDLTFRAMEVVRAPYLYLYPSEATDVTIKIGVPSGGNIIDSEPPYNSGWSVRAEPNGLIDGTYPYLFYEAEVSFEYNLRYGWLLDGSDLENEWRCLLTDCGLVGREIDDFVEFWIPVIGAVSWLAVYPQDASAATTLDISPAPDRMLRVLFILKELAKPVAIEPPRPTPPFEREGFTVVEWGVLGLPN